ncbi:MAG: hypothetical protein MZV65_35690 [Chromatiales bacterium]|nr:hypothetical protein [Chromatiales bacterium]
MTGRIPDEILDAPVGGVNLLPGSLRRQLAPGDTLLVFLRQLGCLFCRETVSDLKACRERDQHIPGCCSSSRAARSRAALAAQPLARGPRGGRSGRRFYAGFGVGRGSLWQTLGPEVWRARSRATPRVSSRGPAWATCG